MLNKEPKFVPREKQITMSEALRQKQNLDVLYKLVYTTLAMIFVPLAVYFVVNNVIGGFLDLQANQASMYAGFSAVAAVLCIMVAFVIMAFNEADEPTDADKKTS